MVTASPSPSIRTSPNATFAPGSPSSFSTTRMSPGWTRYCLPPVLITAYIVRAFGVDMQNGMRPQESPRARGGALYTRKAESQRRGGRLAVTTLRRRGGGREADSPNVGGGWKAGVQACRLGLMAKLPVNP